MPRNITLAAVLLAASLAIAGCSSSAPTESATSAESQVTAAPATGETISGTGYSFAAPEGWSVPEGVSPTGVDVVVADLADADGFSDNVNVVLSPAGEVTSDQVESLGVAELEGAGATDVKTRDRITVAGSEAAHLAGGFSSNGAEYHIDQFYLSNAGQTYIVTLSTSPALSESDRDALWGSVLASWAWS